MSLVTKPTDTPEWASDPGAAIVSPPQLKREAGWIVEKPPHQYMNWWMYYVYLWIVYFENRSDAYQQYDAIVKTGSLGTHTTLTAAIAAVSAGARILVAETQVVNTSAIVVDKAVEIVLNPSIEIQKGTSAQGLSITASGARIKGGKVTGFVTAGNKGIVVDAAATRVKIGEVDFSGNDTDIDDQSGMAAIYGCHYSA